MKILFGLLAVVALLIGALLALPFLVDLAAYQDQYKPLIEEALNRKIQLQSIRLTIWPRLGARVAGFTVLDDPSFGTGPFASLNSLDVGVKLWPLLSGKVEVEEITLREPVITVIKNKAGVTNVSTIGPKTASSAAPQPETPQQGDPLQALALLAVDRVAIDRGLLTYRDLSRTPTVEHQIHDLQLLLESVHLGETPTLHLSALVQPQRLPITLDGAFGPLVQTLELKHYAFALKVGTIDMAIQGALVGGKLDATVTSPSIRTTDLPLKLPLTKPVEIQDLRLTAKAPYPLKQGVPAMELADITDLTLAVVTGNTRLNIKGSVLGGHAKAAVTSPSVNTADLPVETGLKKPVEIKNLSVQADLRGEDARLSDLSFQLFDGQAKGQGALTLGAPMPPFNGKVTLQGLHVKPALDAVSGESKLSLSGTAAAAIAVAGRGFSMPDLTKALEGPGHLEVKDGTIDGVNLLQEVAEVLKVAGLSIDQAKATAFSTIETDFFIKQGLVNVQKLLLDSHDFQATGTGAIGLDHSLNLHMNLNLSQTLSQKLAGSSPIAKLAMKDGRLKLPLTIGGTLENPTYGVDLKELTGKVQEQVKEKAKEAVKGLLEGTTKPEDLRQQGKDLLKGLLGR